MRVSYSPSTGQIVIANIVIIKVVNVATVKITIDTIEIDIGSTNNRNAP